jgi:hypothetical protein
MADIKSSFGRRITVVLLDTGAARTVIAETPPSMVACQTATGNEQQGPPPGGLFLYGSEFARRVASALPIGGIWFSLPAFVIRAAALLGFT